MQLLKRAVDANHETIQSLKEEVKYLKNELNITKIFTEDKIKGYLFSEDAFKKKSKA